jgi:Ca-activated chloride channel family protein
MRFAHPQLLWLLTALGPLALFLFLRARAARRALVNAFGAAMTTRLTEARWAPARVLRPALLLAAVALLVIGAARPQRGTHYVTAKRMGRDVVIALDVSESMLAEDLRPNRLQRAKHEISAILDRLKGDRIALVAFSGSGFVQCPLTLDYSAARLFLDFMNPELVPDPGTSLAEALRVSLRAFDTEGEGFRALILITDGEDLTGGVEEAARAARTAGVRVFTVGIGSEAGEPIPERDAGGKVVGYKKDREGRVVMTRLDPSVLQEIARTTDGLYVPASGTLGLERVLDAIDKMERREMSGGVRMLYEERYRYVVWPALILLLIEFWVPGRRPERVPKGALRPGRLLAWLRGASVALAISLAGSAAAQTTLTPPPIQPASPAAPAGPGNAAAADPKWRELLEENEVFRSRHPNDPRPFYNLGNLRQQQGDHDSAEALYQGATGRAEGELAQHAFYNLGESLFRSGRLEEARAAFLEALRRDPNDTDAKVNLELTQQRIDQQPAQPDSSQSSQSDSTGQSQSSKKQSGSQDQQQQGKPPDQGKQPQQQGQPPDQASPPQNAGQPGAQNTPPQNPPSGAPESWDQARADSVSADDLQMMQILRGLENQERQLMMRRFQARSRNLRVEKDW